VGPRLDQVAEVEQALRVEYLPAQAGQLLEPRAGGDRFAEHGFVDPGGPEFARVVDRPEAQVRLQHEAPPVDRHALDPAGLGERLAVLDRSDGDMLAHEERSHDGRDERHDEDHADDRRATLVLRRYPAAGGLPPAELPGVLSHGRSVPYRKDTTQAFAAAQERGFDASRVELTVGAGDPRGRRQRYQRLAVLPAVAPEQPAAPGDGIDIGQQRLPDLQGQFVPGVRPPGPEAALDETVTQPVDHPFEAHRRIDGRLAQQVDAHRAFDVIAHEGQRAPTEGVEVAQGPGASQVFVELREQHRNRPGLVGMAHDVLAARQHRVEAAP